jgi:branched-chain amino acid transport system ATP-binding protein
MSYLNVQSITTYYGDVLALRQVSVEVGEGEIVTLIGANGAGKSTTLRTISGLIRPAQGHILFQDRQIEGLKPEKIARMGIAHVPEGRRILPGLTVFENLELGTSAWPHSGWRLHRKGFDSNLEMIYGLFPVLKARSRQLGWSLSGGEQQMLAIGRALMSNPRLVLLDEPSLGLAPNLVIEVFKTIRKINRQGTTILLVEQNANMAMRVARRCYVLENGSVVLSGEASRLFQNEQIRAAYLGGSL